MFVVYYGTCVGFLGNGFVVNSLDLAQKSMFPNCFNITDNLKHMSYFIVDEAVLPTLMQLDFGTLLHTFKTNELSDCSEVCEDLSKYLSMIRMPHDVLNFSSGQYKIDDVVQFQEYHYVIKIKNMVIDFKRNKIPTLLTYVDFEDEIKLNNPSFFPQRLRRDLRKPDAFKSKFGRV